MSLREKLENLIIVVVYLLPGTLGNTLEFLFFIPELEKTISLISLRKCNRKSLVGSPINLILLVEPPWFNLSLLLSLATLCKPWNCPPLFVRKLTKSIEIFYGKILTLLKKCISLIGIRFVRLKIEIALAIKKPKTPNKALLAKLGWNLVSNSSSLWACVLK